MNSSTDATPPHAAEAALMTAIAIDAYGDAEALGLRQVQVPDVGDSDMLIRVAFAGVASWDATERAGHYDGAFGVPTTFPFILGWDAAGTVAARGRDVTRFKVGDRVYAATIPVVRGGTYAHYAVVEDEHVAHLPARVPMEQAGALAWDALTALSGIELLDLKPGNAVMIFGASGGLGHMAVQLARHLGLRVFAVASGEDGVALAQRLGADAVVDGRTDDVLAAATAFAPDGFDGAVMTVDGDRATSALGAVKASATAAIPNGAGSLESPAGGPTVEYYDGDRSRVAFDRLNAIIEANSFEVHVAQTFTLESAVDAHRALASHYVGKMVLSVSN